MSRMYATPVSLLERVRHSPMKTSHVRMMAVMSLRSPLRSSHSMKMGTERRSPGSPSQ